MFPKSFQNMVRIIEMQANLCYGTLRGHLLNLFGITQSIRGVDFATLKSIDYIRQIGNTQRIISLTDYLKV